MLTILQNEMNIQIKRLTGMFELELIRCTGRDKSVDTPR